MTTYVKSWNKLILTLDKRQIKDCIWFLPTESPTKAKDFPLTMSKNWYGLKTGKSHPSGLHFHFMNSESGRPYFMQF